MFLQLHTIGRNTFVEAIRQPIYAVVCLLALLLLIMNPSIAMYTLEDDNRLLLDLGISTLLIAGLLLAAFTASGVISQEVENKTVLTVVSKPVSRPIFVLGKYLGIAAALLQAYLILCLTLLMTARHGVMQDASKVFDMPVLTFGLIALIGSFLVAALGNYFYHWVFTSSLSRALAIKGVVAFILVQFVDNRFDFQFPGTNMDPELVKGMYILFMGLLILAAIAVAASTRLGVIMTLITCSIALVMGLFADYMMSSKAAQSATATANIIRTLYAFLPNMQLFWPADALSQAAADAPMIFSLKYMGLITAFALAFIGAILSLAVALFQTREVG